MLGPLFSLNVVDSEFESVFLWNKVMKVPSGFVLGVDEEVQGGVVVDLFEQFGVEDFLPDLQFGEDHFVVCLHVQLGDVDVAFHGGLIFGEKGMVFAHVVQVVFDLHGERASESFGLSVDFVFHFLETFHFLFEFVVKFFFFSVDNFVFFLEQFYLIVDLVLDPFDEFALILLKSVNLLLDCNQSLLLFFDWCNVLLKFEDLGVEVVEGLFDCDFITDHVIEMFGMVVLFALFAQRHVVAVWRLADVLDVVLGVTLDFATHFFYDLSIRSMQ